MSLKTKIETLEAHAESLNNMCDQLDARSRIVIMIDVKPDVFEKEVDSLKDITIDCIANELQTTNFCGENIAVVVTKNMSVHIKEVK